MESGSSGHNGLNEGNGRRGLFLRSPRQALEPAEAPPPPKRSRQARHSIVVVFNFFITAMVLGAIGAFAVIHFGKTSLQEAGPLDTTRTVVVREGSSVARIAQQLESAGVIDSELMFRIAARAYGVSSELKAGEYAFNPGTSMYDVMRTIESGKGISHKVTFPEGWTTHQIFERLAENEILTGELPDELPPEGSLLPDTYPFQRGTSRGELVEQMRQARQRTVQEIWESRIDGLPVSSPEEMVVLASIVEKETGKADERPLVASVFINRLNRGMKLQSDPTIIYGLFGGEGKPADRPIYKSDIDKPTPYNTYVIEGLPPGPIANPGRAALEAVANPSRTNNLYFVADGTGGHVFAVTLEEHNENVRRWRAIEKRLQQERERVAEEAASDAVAADGEETVQPATQ